MESKDLSMRKYSSSTRAMYWPRGPEICINRKLKLTSRLPCHLNEGYSLSGQFEIQFDLTGICASPVWRSEHLELTRGFQLRVLSRLRLLR